MTLPAPFRRFCPVKTPCTQQMRLAPTRHRFNRPRRQRFTLHRRRSTQQRRRFHHSTACTTRATAARCRPSLLQQQQAHTHRLCLQRRQQQQVAGPGRQHQPGATCRQASLTGSSSVGSDQTAVPVCPWALHSHRAAPRTRRPHCRVPLVLLLLLLLLHPLFLLWTAGLWGRPLPTLVGLTASPPQASSSERNLHQRRSRRRRHWLQLSALQTAGRSIAAIRRQRQQQLGCTLPHPSLMQRAVQA